MTATLDLRAVALRPVRIVGGVLRVYEGTTFPRGPFVGCETAIRRLSATGGLADGEDCRYAVLDVLDEEGDVIQDFALTKSGFNYLRRQWRFQVEPKVRA